MAWVVGCRPTGFDPEVVQGWSGALHRGTCGSTTLQRGPLRSGVLVYLILYVIAGLVVVAGVVTLHRAAFADRSRGRPRCPKCWYDMTGSRGFVCPECGNDAVRQTNLYRTRRKGMEALLGALLIILGGSLAVLPTVQDQGWCRPPTPTLMIVMPWTDNVWVFDEVDARVNGAYPEWFDRRQPTGDNSAYGRFFAYRCAAVVENSASRPLRLRAVQLLSDMRLHDDRAQRALLAATGDVDPTIRLEALNALIRVADANSIIDRGRCARRVAECLSDTRVAVRTRAARFFDCLQPPHADALPALIDALSDERVEVRAAVCGVLFNFGPIAAPALPKLIKLIDDPSAPVSARAMLTLGAMGKAALPAMDQLLNATRVEDQRGSAALRAIAGLGPFATAAIPHLTTMLTDQTLPDDRRDLALAALLEISPYVPAVLDAIELGATCNLESIRRRTAAELGRFHADEPRQVRLLLGLLADTSAAVRQEAFLSLGRLTPLREEDLAQLRQLAEDPNFIGWEQAQSALSRALEDLPVSDPAGLGPPIAGSRR